MGKEGVDERNKGIGDMYNDTITRSNIKRKHKWEEHQKFTGQQFCERCLVSKNFIKSSINGFIELGMASLPA